MFDPQLTREAHKQLTYAIEAEDQAERYAVALMQAECHGDVETHINHLASLALHYALKAGAHRRAASMFASTYDDRANVEAARMMYWTKVYQSVAI